MKDIILSIAADMIKKFNVYSQEEASSHESMLRGNQKKEVTEYTRGQKDAVLPYMFFLSKRCDCLKVVYDYDESFFRASLPERFEEESEEDILKVISTLIDMMRKDFNDSSEEKYFSDKDVESGNLDECVSSYYAGQMDAIKWVATIVQVHFNRLDLDYEFKGGHYEMITSVKEA